MRLFRLLLCSEKTCAGHLVSLLLRVQQGEDLSFWIASAAQFFRTDSDGLLLRTSVLNFCPTLSQEG